MTTNPDHARDPDPDLGPPSEPASPRAPHDPDHDAVVVVRRSTGLSPWMRPQLRAFAETFYADDSGPPPPDRVEWALDELGQLLAHGGVRGRLLFRASLLTLTFLVPLILVGRLRRFASLSEADRALALHRAETSPAGLAVFLIRALLSIHFYEHPESAAAIGWDQRCMHEGRAS